MTGNPYRRRRHTVLLLLLALVLPLLGCGRKSAPLPPEDVLPAAIANLSATNVASGIQLSWARPTRYVDGRRMTDLAGFVVLRSEGTGPPGPAQQIADLEVSDRDRFRQIKRFRYIDADTIVGVSYHYQVVSYTVDRYSSASSNIVSIERAAVADETHAPLPTPPR